MIFQSRRDGRSLRNYFRSMRCFSTGRMTPAARLAASCVRRVFHCGVREPLLEEAHRLLREDDSYGRWRHALKVTLTIC
jgi:hypothetical protein